MSGTHHGLCDDAHFAICVVAFGIAVSAFIFIVPKDRVPKPLDVP